MSRVPVVLSLILFSAWILLTRAVENQATLRDDSGVGFDSTTKEGILANRERRKQQLKNLVNGMRKQLADHSAGEKTLSPDEKETMERRLHLFQQKIESMKKDLDDRVCCKQDCHVFWDLLFVAFLISLICIFFSGHRKNNRSWREQRTEAKRSQAPFSWQWRWAIKLY